MTIKMGRENQEIRWKLWKKYTVSVFFLISNGVRMYLHVISHIIVWTQQF